MRRIIYMWIFIWNNLRESEEKMPRYSDEIIDEVRQTNDIVDIISQYVHLKRSGRNFFGLCPFLYPE